MGLVTMTTEASRKHAEAFFQKLDQVMGSDFIGPQQMVLNALDMLHEVFTEAETNCGYVVQNTYYNGNEIDLFHEVTKTYWDATLYDSDLRSGNNISFFDLDSSRLTFLIVLGTQVLINIPDTVEMARLHVKRQLASVFNGANVYGVQFQLRYIDYNLMDGEYSESCDLSDMLIA